MNIRGNPWLKIVVMNIPIVKNGSYKHIHSKNCSHELYGYHSKKIVLMNIPIVKNGSSHQHTHS
jgi:hypothetical protein